MGFVVIIIIDSAGSLLTRCIGMILFLLTSATAEVYERDSTCVVCVFINEVRDFATATCSHCEWHIEEPS